MTLLSLSSVVVQQGAAPLKSAGGVPADANYACPMETHLDEADASRQGAYFSAQPGRCPWCGMELKPLAELPWARIRKAAEGADVAHTCPDHQHVFSKSGGECPRCGRRLMPFKVMYTCPDPQHAGVIRAASGNCPHCGRGLAAYRGVWLDESMADANLPPTPGLAEAGAFRCPIHPLVHSAAPGACTICARPLEGKAAEASEQAVTIPANATYACPMQECGQFSDKPGACPICGMKLKPIERVAWAKAMSDRQRPADRPGYVCPMHASQVAASEPGACSICGMQLVHAATFAWPKDAPEIVAAHVDYITEHYLELHALLAADRVADVARQALAIVAAGDELARHVDDSGVVEPAMLRSATERLRTAALKIRGTDLEQDRVAFVELSAAVRAMIDLARPSRQRWPKLYVYHCPMSKGDWIQTAQEKRNPYYGFKMLTCGELKDVK